MAAATPEVFSAFQCPVCHSATDPLWSSSARAAGSHPFQAGGCVSCRDCGAAFPVHHGYLDLQPGDAASVSPFQRLMQWPPAVAVYEGVWRPLGYFIASKHSFPKDLERIASLVQQRHGMILDLACGPGNVTRQLARLAPEATVIGFDLSPQMLERAVRLTRKEKLKNVYYVRGSALTLPFRPESFEAVTCCGALQLFSDQDRAVGEIARVLKLQGEFVCQTTFAPKRPHLVIRLADQMLKFGYFYLDDLRDRLSRFNFHLTVEEQSKITYIFHAAKTHVASRPPKHETARPSQAWLRAAPSAD
jgi:ubiquinone/menaquinone biosynthesis C-methylase UbiE